MAGEVLRKIGSVNYIVKTNEREVRSHANFMKERFIFLRKNNPLLDFFEIDLPYAQIEPEIIPEAEAEDIFEDAIEEQQETRAVENDLPIQQPVSEAAALRRSQRINAEIPPQHLQGYVRTVKTS